MSLLQTLPEIKIVASWHVFGRMISKFTKVPTLVFKQEENDQKYIYNAWAVQTINYVAHCSLLFIYFFGEGYYGYQKPSERQTAVFSCRVSVIRYLYKELNYNCMKYMSIYINCQHGLHPGSGLVRVNMTMLCSLHEF